MAWAEWIAWQLENKGYPVELDVRDWHSGENFVSKMHQAVIDNKCMILVLSRAYFTSPYTQAEWTAALAQIFTDKNRHLITLRIDDVDPPGLLTPYVSIDLHELQENEALERLLQHVKEERGKPSTSPQFPGKKQPRFPGALPPVSHIPYLRHNNFTGGEEVLDQPDNVLESSQSTAPNETIHFKKNYMKSMATIIFITDGFGPSYGGINSFNYDLSMALGESFADTVKTINMIIAGEFKKAENTRYKGTIDIHEYKKDAFEDHEMVEKLLKKVDCGKEHILWWIGHDVISGNNALSFCKIARRIGFIHSQCAVFHHMDYQAYQDLKSYYPLKDGTLTDEELKKILDEMSVKEENQVNILKQAEKVFSVGPLLTVSASLKLSLVDNPKTTEPVEIIPGLAKIEPLPFDRIKNYKQIISYGRIDEEVDVIKQFSLAVMGFSKYQSKENSDKSKTLKLYGLNKEIQKYLGKIYRICEETGGYISNIHGRLYTQNREQLFSELKTSIACLMLSLHEGFGLVGWEAIAGEVPLILTENSGLFQFLKNKGNEYIALCKHFRIKGSMTNKYPFAREDLDNVVNYLEKILLNVEEAKRDAQKLKEKLNPYTWEKTARDFLKGLGIDTAKENINISPPQPINNDNGYITERKHYNKELIGRETDKEILKGFFENDHEHFFLLWGVGGIGKTHLYHDVLTDLKRKFRIFNVQCHRDFTLAKLFRECRIHTYDDNMCTEDKLKLFIEEFTRKNIYLSLEDFYDVIDPEVRNLVTTMVHVCAGKLLVISRAIPRELVHTHDHYPNHKLPPLQKIDYFKLLDNYACWKNSHIHLTDRDKEHIYKITGGYPLAVDLIIRLLNMGEGIDEILKNLVTFDEEMDSSGKKFSDRLLGIIFEKEEQKEVTLLSEFCAFTEPIKIEALKYLLNFNRQILESLFNKDFIWLGEDKKLSTHSLVREFAYDQLKNKEQTHTTIAGYYESLIQVCGLEDIDSFEMALFHHRAAGTAQSFIERSTSLFRGRNVKELIDKNINSTIKRFKYGIELYPRYLPFYNELGIAYRENKQYDLAIAILTKAINIDK
ncbi:MAG: TIR domain-containing protein, partial [Spirochaetales bacterium]|nr:TIR domain-containing protein [Spirochaetales bacterium]